MVLHSLAPRLRLIVPLERFDDVILDNGEGVDDVGAQSGVDVLGQELGRWWTILGPVRVVTHTYIFRGPYTRENLYECHRQPNIPRGWYIQVCTNLMVDPEVLDVRFYFSYVETVQKYFGTSFCLS